VDAKSEIEDRADYDLTCWYLNVRRVMELLGAESVAADLRNLGALVDLNDQARKLGLLVTLKDGLTRWLKGSNPPTLGQLIVEERLRPDILFLLTMIATSAGV
jgi:hypothetical protein